jgi:DNA-binding NarL/FixJ family response regulator
MKKMKTLLVDNNEHVQRAMRSFLITLPEIELIGCAASGEEALRETARLEPDLVVMEVNMPGMNGFEATRRMRAIDPAPRVVMVALFDEFAYRAHAKRCGAVTLISKMDVMAELPGLVTRLAGDAARDEAGRAKCAAPPRRTRSRERAALPLRRRLKRAN